MYAFEFQGQSFTPEGKRDVGDVAEHNREIERKEIESLKQHPERVCLYAKDGQIATWLGTIVSKACHFGPRVRSGFGWNTYRCSVDCSIFGVRYVGWFFESSGDYCRLRKAKQ